MVSRCLALIPDARVLQTGSNLLLATAYEIESRQRQIISRKNPLHPVRKSYDGTNELTRSIAEANSPWSRLPVKSCDIPMMIGDEEKRYYSYIATFYQGDGAAIEIGPWLGGSTYYIIQALLDNPHFAGRSLHVYDNFIWQDSYMTRHVKGLLPADYPAHLAGFRSLFDRFTEGFRDHLVVRERSLAESGSPHDPPRLDAWEEEESIEMVFVDCGRTIELNDAWYSVFRPFFLPNRTLIVMQDWHTYRDVPLRWFNQIKMFTDSKGAALDLIHEVRHGGVATFLYRG